MTRVLCLALVVAGLACAEAAVAHPWNAWHWAPYRAESRILIDPPFSWKLKDWKVVGVECYGIGRRIWRYECSTSTTIAKSR